MPPFSPTSAFGSASLSHNQHDAALCTTEQWARTHVVVNNMRLAPSGRGPPGTCVAPSFVTSPTFAIAHQFCQFISTTFVNLASFVKCCQLRGHQFCQTHQPLMALQTRSLPLSTRSDHFSFVNRNFIIFSTSATLSHTLKKSVIVLVI